MYHLIIKPLLFLFQPEKAHYLTFNLLKFGLSLPFAKSLARSLFSVQDPRLKREVFGLTFNNPVGLAAGFDKNAKMVDEFACLGFGFVEIGTVTPLPQPGNDLPRLFRLPQDQAVINRMGFNNEGAAAAAQRLRKRSSKLIIGGNIGKNKITDNAQAVADYEKCFDTLYDVVDYFVVNVSSPNTPNLRALQDKEPLTQLLGTLQARNQSKPKAKPILLKIAPDLTNEQLDDIIDIVQNTRIDGIIATNTTIAREPLDTDSATVQAIGAGGLSGKPLTRRATEVISYLYQKSGKTLKIIGVGGIHSPEDALEKLRAGACLVQLYTGYIYEGPSLVKRILKKLQQEAT